MLSLTHLCLVPLSVFLVPHLTFILVALTSSYLSNFHRLVCSQFCTVFLAHYSLLCHSQCVCVFARVNVLVCDSRCVALQWTAEEMMLSPCCDYVPAIQNFCQGYDVPSILAGIAANAIRCVTWRLYLSATLVTSSLLLFPSFSSFQLLPSLSPYFSPLLASILSLFSYDFLG